MNRFSFARLGAAVAGLAMALAACALIPDQNIGDVFGIDDTPVTLDEQAGDLAPAQFTDCPSAGGSHCATVGPSTFGDPDISGIATSIIAGFDVDAGIQATIEATGDPVEQITLTSFGVSLTVSDVETADTVSAAATATATPPVVFEPTGTPGVYAASDVSDLRLTVAFDGSELGTLKDILTGGGDNVGSGVVFVDVEEAGIATMTITLASDGATVSF